MHLKSKSTRKAKSFPFYKGHYKNNKKSCKAQGTTYCFFFFLFFFFNSNLTNSILLDRQQTLVTKTIAVCILNLAQLVPRLPVNLSDFVEKLLESSNPCRNKLLKYNTFQWLYFVWSSISFLFCLHTVTLRLSCRGSTDTIPLYRVIYV